MGVGAVGVDWMFPGGWSLCREDRSSWEAIPVDRAAGPQEQPQRRVYLDAFEIDRYEVTNVHYLRFVLATGTAWPPFWREDPFPEKMATHPVIGCQLAGSRRLLPMGGETSAD